MFGNVWIYIKFHTPDTSTCAATKRHFTCTVQYSSHFLQYSDNKKKMVNFFVAAVPSSTMLLHSSSAVCDLSSLSSVLKIQLSNDPVPVAVLQHRRTAELRVCRISNPISSPDVDRQFSNLQIEI